jgi:hypothetical protein
MRGRTYARRRQDRQHIADRKDIADREDAYSRSATSDNVSLVTCAVTRYDREDVADREGVADRADVHDREIRKILPIVKITNVLPIGQMFPIERSGRSIGKMIVLFIFRCNFQ